MVPVQDASKAPIKGQVASSMRNLQELLLAERADSLVITDSRTGSIVGAPTMQFKKPSPAAIQARVAMEAAAAASERPEKHKDRGALLAATRAAVASVSLVLRDTLLSFALVHARVV